VRIAVTGASGVLGRGLAARLLSKGHDVTGIARHRPESWPGAANFVAADIRDAAAVRRIVAGADVVAHCAWAHSPGPDDRISRHVNIGGTVNVLEAMVETGTERIAFVSSAHVYGAADAAMMTERDAMAPLHADGLHKARVEEMLAASGAQWVAIRSALILGRGIDNWVRRVLALPAFPDGSADRGVQVVHLDDALRLLVRAVLDTEIDSGPVNLAATGAPTFRQIASALGRPPVPLGSAFGRLGLPGAAELELMRSAPWMDTSRLREEWGFLPAWKADECIEDFALAVRGRVTLGKRVISLPWRLASITDLPAVDAPADDGVVPRLAGPEGVNGEFDTPIDPRFPTYLATNLSEALPGPFSPSSASVTVRGLRAGGARIAERLRPGGMIQREIAMRTVAVFAHRLYGAITSAHFMAETVPFAKPATIVSNSGFFGPSMASLPIFGAERPPEFSRARRLLRNIRNVGVFGVNLVGLSAGSPRDTDDFIADVDRLERLAGGDVTQLDDRRLLSLILLARDHVVHGWLLASGSFMLCAAFNVLLRGLCGRDTAPPAGPELVSARSVEAVQRLVVAARRDAGVTRLLAEPGKRLDALAEQAPEFHGALLAELALIGHRGPAEVEMCSTSYADDPELLVRMVGRALSAPPAPTPRHPQIPLRARPVALLAARQLRDREARRDKMVRAIWVLRGLLREYGRRLTDAGVFDKADDVFYLLVDELDALPADVEKLVAHRRAEQRRLAAVVPPIVFSGESECAGDGCAAVCGSCGPRPSTTCNPARFLSRRSPTSGTPRHSATQRPW
jgi:nucleoside-diphosphate-sugar epimerase